MIYNERITITALGVTAVWDNKSVQYAVTSTGTANDGVQPMALFAICEGTNITRMCIMKLYGVKIYEGDILKAEFIPCKNASNAFGLYDLVAGKFWSSAGSGQFTGA